MRILLVGGHQKTHYLCRSLKAKRHSVTIINEEREFCEFLTNRYDVDCIVGDGTKPYLLEDAGAYEMDAVIALTHSDSNNLVICQLAKKKFGVTQTIAIASDPKNVDVFKRLGVDKIISVTATISSIIESEAFLGNIKSYLPLENGRVACAEFDITDNSPIKDKPLSEAGLPNGVIVGCVLRNDQTIVPQGDTVLWAGDRIILISAPNSIDKASHIITGKKK